MYQGNEEKKAPKALPSLHWDSKSDAVLLIGYYKNPNGPLASTFLN